MCTYTHSHMSLNNNNKASIPGVLLSLSVVPECDGLERLAFRDGDVVQLSTTQAGAPVARALASRATQRRNGPG